MTIYQDYDRLEAEAGKHVGTFILESFRSAWFAKTGRMTGIDDDSELWRSLNSHHEDRLRRITENHMRGKMSEAELSIAERAFAVTKKLCATYGIHPSLMGLSALASSLFQLRGAQLYLQPGDLVLEIGPGSGFLSLMMAQAGAHVYAIECTKMHYMFQNRLFGCADLPFVEGMDSAAIAMPTSLQGSITHLPWWKIAKASDWEGMKGRFKLVTCNHAFLEMHQLGREFYVHLAAFLLKPDGMLMMEGAGEPASPRFDFPQLINLFRSSGLSQAWAVNAGGSPIIGSDIIYAGSAVVQPPPNANHFTAAYLEKFLALGAQITPRPDHFPIYTNEDWLKDWGITH